MPVTVTVRAGRLDDMPTCSHGRILGYCDCWPSAKYRDLKMPPNTGAIFLNSNGAYFADGRLTTKYERGMECHSALEECRSHPGTTPVYWVYEGAICRAAQSTLEGACRYMSPGRVLIMSPAARDEQCQ